MASKFFRTYKSQDSKIWLLENQKKMMQENYDFLDCKIKDAVLVCIGWLTSPDYKNKYKVEIRCVAEKEPWCKIVVPEDIKPSSEIHMYDDRSLCLHYPPDMKWTGNTPIYRYTIPWVAEWISFYELYLVNGGKWKGRESPVHFKQEERNIKEDFRE
jgi:hypothetical protein